MLYLFLFLAVIFSVCSDESALAVTENDPSTLVEGVSVITGDLYAFEEDYVVQGAEPIRIRRSFLSREGMFKNYQHLTARFQLFGNKILVNEPNGTVIHYYPDLQNKISPAIGDDFFGEKKKHRKILRYNAITGDDRGVANTKTGEISAHTNLKNQYILFDPSKDEKGKSFTLYASDGTIRKYVNFTDQEKIDGPYGEHYAVYYYKLVSETLPNGHMIHYRCHKKNRIDRIYTTDISQRKIFASLDIPVNEGKDFLSECTLTGSDQRSVTYKFQPTEVKRLYIMNAVVSPDLPDQGLDWSMKTCWAKKAVKVPYLTDYRLPKRCVLKVDYDDSYEHRVKSLSSPVGKDGNLVTTHSFIYDVPNKNSYVLDATNNKTAYFWNDEYRLSKVQRFTGSNLIHSSDVFLWDKTNLKCKTFLDERSNPLFSRVYAYDVRGNVKEETLYGNLSGKGVGLTIGSSGLPLENGVESFTRKSSYSDDGRNLLIKQEEGNGLTIKYTYRSDSQLIESKSLCDGNAVKILHTYQYDGDLVFIGEIIDDGVSRMVKKITPCKEGAFIGMPETIEELDGDGFLLTKTVLHYGPGATILQKDVYDSTGKMRYSLKAGYDDKGRLLRETNAIGQEATYRYDEMGNRVYAKDFSGRLETFYVYDFSNRLIKKEEKGDDGVHRIYRYEYDVKHNLVSETDPYENETKYVPDAFGHRKEIHYPSLGNEGGEFASSVVKFKYDSAGNQIEMQDAEGNVTKTSYNAYGKPILTIHPDETQEESVYFLDGNLKAQTDSKMIVTTYEYDYLGRVVSKKTSNAIETYEYLGQYLVKKTDAEGNVTTYKYDRAGRKISEECSGEETSYTYDEFGRLRTTQKGGLFAITEYDLQGRVVEERNESIDKEVLRKVKYEYDLAGNRKTIIRTINGKDAREEFKYDSVGRVIQKKNALGFVETYEYDPKVNRKIHTDSMGLQTVETYNPRGQTSSIERKKHERSLSLSQKYYNKNGALSLQVDTVYTPDGEQRKVRTRWEYDSRGRIKTLTEAEGTLEAKITKYEYTPRGELSIVTKPDGVLLRYLYNDYGHLESLTSSDGTVNHLMKYNLMGHLQESDDLIRKTDPFGRILYERFPIGHTIENRYDNRGRRRYCKIPAADCLIAYEYDPADLKKVVRKNLDETVLYSHTYSSYDLSGNLLEQNLIQDGGILVFSIDDLGRKTAINSPQFNQEVVEFDGVGNIHKMKTGLEEACYTYDDLYQLTSESGLFSHSYMFDSLNNRIQKDEDEYEINSLNQIVLYFQYDRNGNPIQQGKTTYAYDALDRLVRIETSDFIQTFTYDSFHRCLSKTIIQCGEAKTVYFLYDGQKEIGAFDERLTPIELRILGNTPHAEIGAAVAIELSGEIHTPIHDLQGNLAALLQVGSDPTFYRYSAFGEEKIFGEAISPWRFSSKRSDSQTHLVYFGRRYYIPSFGRWLTPDPAGFTDGMNLYAYVHNDPLTHLDEYGLFEALPYDFSSYAYNAWSRSHRNKPDLIRFKSGPYSFCSYNSPVVNVNGIMNTCNEAISGARTLARTLGVNANVVALHSESRGIKKDLSSVRKARKKDYTSVAVRHLNRELRWDIICFDAMNDPRKVFVQCFSRGAADTYHACKSFTREQRDRLIITACGPIMTLERNLGFRVMNLISKGDECSLYYHYGLKEDPHVFDSVADVYLLKQKDGFSGVIGDHFFKSKTYQKGIKDFTLPLYDEYGILK